MIVSLAGAWAQDIPTPRVDAQTYRIPVDAGRTMWADDAGGNAGFSARLGVGYVKDPFVWVWEDTGEKVAVVGDVLAVDAIAAYRVWRLRFGVDVPAYPLVTGSAAGAGTGGLGDIALDAKAVVLDPVSAPMGLALSGRFGIPTATMDVPLAGDGLGWEAAIIADKDAGPVRLAANLGVRGSPGGGLENVEISNQFTWRAGAGWAITDAAGLSADFAGALSLSDPGNAAGSPVEGMLGGWVRVAEPIALRAGVGRGFTSGIGAAAFRGVFALSYEPPAPKPKSAAPPPRGVLTIGDTTSSTPGTVRIEIRDESGTPIDATVTFGSHPAAPIGGGRATARVAAGTWNVRVAAPGRASQDVVVVVASEATSDLRLTLREARVAIGGDRLVLNRKIGFEGSKIRAESVQVLEEVAALLAAHPELKGIRIESHTDSRSAMEYALTLSGTRAAAVQAWLVNKGLAPERFIAAGYGGSRPVVKADTEAAWEANDRIEFVITSR